MNPKTFVTLNADQLVPAGIPTELTMQVLVDDNLSFQENGFVAKESGDYRVTVIQQIAPFDGAGKVQLQVSSETADYILALQGNNSQCLTGSRVIRLKAGEKLVPKLYVSDSIDVTVLADPVKSEMVFERI